MLIIPDELEAARRLVVQRGWKVGVNHRRLIGYQRGLPWSFLRIAISVLCDVRGLSLCLSGALP